MENTCQTCIHYLQHYAKKNLRLIKLDHGHCLKHINKKLLTCKSYKEKDFKQEAVTNKKITAEKIDCLINLFEEIKMILKVENI